MDVAEQVQKSSVAGYISLLREKVLFLRHLEINKDRPNEQNHYGMCRIMTL